MAPLYAQGETRSARRRREREREEGPCGVHVPTSPSVELKERSWRRLDVGGGERTDSEKKRDFIRGQSLSLSLSLSLPSHTHTHTHTHTLATNTWTHSGARSGTTGWEITSAHRGAPVRARPTHPPLLLLLLLPPPPPPPHPLPHPLPLLPRPGGWTGLNAPATKKKKRYLLSWEDDLTRMPWREARQKMDNKGMICVELMTVHGRGWMVNSG